jgi:UDP-N-acetyl-2-amino-2-deoxyglucuronate dehydrogenase
MTMKLAFVGTGLISEAHLRGLAELNESAGERLFELTAVADPRLDAAESFAGEAERLLGRRPEVYDDYRPMLDKEDLDAAALLVPHSVHWSIARDCLEAGLHLQVQKPIAITIADGRRIIDLAAEKGRSLVVSEPAVLGRRQRALVDALRSGTLVGSPTMLLDYAVTVVDGAFFGGTPWRHLKGMAGAGWFVDHGVHRTHWFLEALGGVERVWGMAKTFEPVRSDDRHGSFEVDTEDCAMTGLQFVDGILGHFLVASAGRGQRFGEVRVYGTDGVVNLTDGRVHRGESSTAIDQLCDSFLDNDLPIDPMAHSFLELHRLVVDGQAPICTGERALEALAIIYACLESNLIESPVGISEVLAGTAHAYEDTVEAARARWLDFEPKQVS